MTHQRSQRAQSASLLTSDSVFVDFLHEVYSPDELSVRGDVQPSQAECAAPHDLKDDDSQPSSTIVQQTCHLVPQPQGRKPVPAKRSRNQEANKNCQQRYRARHKARADALQANLVETMAQLNALRKAMKVMQTDNQKLLESVSAAKAQAAVYASGSMRHLRWQEPDVIDCDLFNRVMPLWRSGKVLTCSITAEQAHDMSQISSLTPQQLAIVWQRYTNKMSASLQANGPDMSYTEAAHLRQLLDEFSCIHCLKIRGDPAGHKASIGSPVTYSGNTAAALRLPPDYQAAAVLMQYSPLQKRKLLSLRQTFIVQLALCSRRRQQLVQQLQQCPGALGVSKEEMFNSQACIDAITQQIQDCTVREHHLFMQYTIAVAHGVLTTWQCAVYLVWAFPYLSEMTAAMNALAELEGDPSVSQVAAQALADPLLAATVQPTDEPFEVDISRLSGDPTAVPVYHDASQPVSDLAAKATQVVLSTSVDDLTPGDIFGG